jgi:hypothetical protein
VSTTNSCGTEAKEMGMECRSGGDKGTVGGVEETPSEPESSRGGDKE